MNESRDITPIDDLILPVHTSIRPEQPPQRQSFMSRVMVAITAHTIIATITGTIGWSGIVAAVTFLCSAVLVALNFQVIAPNGVSVEERLAKKVEEVTSKHVAQLKEAAEKAEAKAEAVKAEVEEKVVRVERMAATARKLAEIKQGVGDFLGNASAAAGKAFGGIGNAFSSMGEAMSWTAKPVDPAFVQMLAEERKKQEMKLLAEQERQKTIAQRHARNVRAERNRVVLDQMAAQLNAQMGAYAQQANAANQQAINNALSRHAYTTNAVRRP